jgi:hypothetical protein
MSLTPSKGLEVALGLGCGLPLLLSDNPQVFPILRAASSATTYLSAALGSGGFRAFPQFEGFADSSDELGCHCCYHAWCHYMVKEVASQQ